MTYGWRTLDVGEKALIYDRLGRARLVDGPMRLFLFREKFFCLPLYSATQSEYLIVNYKDGSVEHRSGPCAVHLNLLRMSSIKVRPAVSLDANEVIVVYRKENDSGKVDSNEVNRKSQGKVTRVLKYGPAIFVPGSNEWLHEFVWHGTDPSNKTHIVPNALKFTKLKLVADQLYYNIDEVRTKDDALVRVKLMLFYELSDVERMLNTTQDPIADLINCLCGDVISFAAERTYVDFIAKAGELSEISNYPKLVEKCIAIGYRVTKVVFRGHFASPRLQQTHDDAIEARTRLKLELEAEQQQQALLSSSLHAELERIAIEQQIETEDLIHQLKMEKLEAVHRLKVRGQEHEAQMRNQELKNDADLAVKRTKMEAKLKFYESLHGLGVQLNEYVLNLNRPTCKTVQVISAPGQSTENNQPGERIGATNIHLHNST